MAIEELQNGRYRYLNPLGSGGMGEVYLMQDTRVSRQVAIKVLRAESALYPGDEKATSSAQLFEREARAIAALDHPNILPLYDFGEEVRDGIAMTYMVMPYCSEGSLETWLRQRGGELLPPQQVAALIEQAAEGLNYAHEHKVIHLDVKPSNFLLRGNRRNPTRPTLLLADFGIARNFTTVSSSSRTIRGTPAAMSPEQWSGAPVFASDQYALAVMAYEMLVGRPPFVGSMEQLMYRHFSVQAPKLSSFNPRISASLDEVLQRALSKKPEERYPSIVDFANALVLAADQPAAFTDEELANYGTLALSQAEAEAGISRMFTLVSGEEVTVSVPAGAQNGQVLRLPRADASDEEAGVVLVSIAIQQPETSRSSNEDIAAPVEQATETPPLPVNAQEKRSDQGAVTPLLPDDVRQEARAVQASESPQIRLAAAASAPISASEHDLPTLAGLGNEQQITMAPRAIAPARRRFGVLALISLLVVLLLAGSIYAFANHQSTAVSAQATPTHVLQPTATPTVAPTATPTVAPGEYIAGTYNGSMQTNSGQTTTLSVYLVQTHSSGALQGSVTFNSSSPAPLKGTVDTHGNFTFSVQQSGGLPFVFAGMLQSGNYLHGNYCRSATSPCLSNDGFFTVGPRS